MSCRGCRYVGRVGGLAVALGVGAAVLTAGSAFAWADDRPAEPSGSSVRSHGSTVATGPRDANTAVPPRSGNASKGSATDARAGALVSPATASVHFTARGRVPAPNDRSPAGQPEMIAGVVSSAPPGGAATSVDATMTDRAAEATPTSAAAAPTLSPVAGGLSSALNPNALPPRPSPVATLLNLLVSVGSLMVSVSREISVAAYRGPTAPMVNMSLELNGYKLLPVSTETVTSLYGRWNYFPGGAGMVQGQQQFDIVDPVSGESLGSFNALVSSGAPLWLRGRYVQLLVTSNDGVNVGTEAGQVPPVGSLIATNHLIGRFGWSYSAMPSASGDVVSFALLTPFGDIPIPIAFDAAKGIADHTVDNRPIYLGNGYNIAPADPSGETFVAVAGVLPLFTTVQGRQMFNISDAAGNTVGSFEGVFTPTADIFGLYTEAILVTSNDGINVGTAAGQVPPVGSVYNVLYQGSDDNYILYSSLPSLSGDVLSLIQVVSGTVRNIRTWPFNTFDASAPPPVRRLKTSRGFSLLPISPLLSFGVNGLPPRDIQIQGHQQFGVYDSAGIQQGSFDADVSNQWDLFGARSTTILVTNVIDGTVGTRPGDVPPVGSMFNYVYWGDTRFGTYYATMPSPCGNVISFKIVTPLFDIPIRTTYNAAEGLTNVSYVIPS